MKIAVINGQNHKGSTYHIGKQVADKLGGEVTEFFLPRDFGDFCVGCTQCFLKSETLCPHYERLKKITEAMDEADVLIFTTPVYVYHCTGSMKAFLDHYGYRWMVHRPEQKMFTKQAVVELSAAQKFHHIVTQMQRLKLCVWVIFIFGQPHQIVGGHAVKLCQRCNRKWADVFVVIALIFPQCRLRQTGLFCQLFQRQVLIHHPQVFEPFLNGEFWLHSGVLPSNFCPFPVLSMSVEICVFQRVFRPLGYTGEGYIFR